MAVGCGGSSSSTSTGGGTSAALQFTAPTAGPTIELGQTVNVMVNQPVTWSLTSNMKSVPPVGMLSNQTGTTATYMAPPLTAPPACTANSLPPPAELVNVVATSTSDSSQSAILSVAIIQAPPCIATLPQFPSCPPSQIFQPGQFAQLFQLGTFAQVSIYDGGGQATVPFGIPPFTWAITSGSLPNGLSLAAAEPTWSAVIGGTPVSPGCSSVTFQVTDAAGVVSPPAIFNFVVIPASLKVQTPSLPNPYVGVPYPASALVASGGFPPYSWVTNPQVVGQQNEGLPPGLSGATASGDSGHYVISGTATSAGVNGFGPWTQPLQVSDTQQPYPAVSLPNISMTPSASGTCSAAAPLQPSTGNGGVSGDGSVFPTAYMQGSYAFLVKGFDADGPVVIAGSVAVSVNADGSGSVTGGEEDITRSSGSQNVAILPFPSSSYIVGPNVNRGCMMLANSAGITNTFAFTLAGCSNNYTEGGIVFTNDNACGMTQNSNVNAPAGFFTTGRIVEFDDNTGSGTRASGILRAQDSSAFSSGLSGSYAFGLSGWDVAGGHYAMAGSTQASSASLSSTAADIDDAGMLNSGLTGGSGSYSAFDSNGRASGMLSVGSASFDLALYMVVGGEAIAMTTDLLGAGHPVVSGELVQSSGSFSNASLHNSHMLHISGVAGTSGPDVSVGVLTFDGLSSFTGTVYEDQAGTLGSTVAAGGYMVDGNTGRTTFQPQQNGTGLGTHSFVAYLLPPPGGLTRATCIKPVSCITGFLVGTDNTAQDGVLEFQTPSIPPPPPFLNNYVTGDFSFGTDEVLDPMTGNLEGDVSARPASSALDNTGSLSGIQDASYGNVNYCLVGNCAFLIPEETFTGNYLVNTNGTGNFGGETASLTNGRVVFYIDESPLNLHPSIIVGEQ